MPPRRVQCLDASVWLRAGWREKTPSYLSPEHPRLGLLSLQVCGLSLAPPKFDAAKLSVKFVGEDASTSRRRYTLTHNDITGQLFLSVGSDYNKEQVSGWCVLSAGTAESGCAGARQGGAARRPVPRRNVNPAVGLAQLPRSRPFRGLELSYLLWAKHTDSCAARSCVISL